MKQNPRSHSAPKSVREWLGPIVLVKSRLGITSRGCGNQCRYCGADDHVNDTERKLCCSAFGTTRIILLKCVEMRIQ